MSSGYGEELISLCWTWIRPYFIHWYLMTDFVQICLFLHIAKYGTDSYFPKILGTENSVANAVDFFLLRLGQFLKIVCYLLYSLKCRWMQFSTVTRYCYLIRPLTTKHTFKIIINHSVNNTFIVIGYSYMCF